MLCLGEGASEQPTHDKGTRKLVIPHKNVNHAAYLVKRWEEYILRSLECSRFARSSQQWDPSIHFPHCGDKSKVLRGIIGFEFAQILKVGYHFKIIFMAILLDANSPYLCCRVLGFNTIVIISKALFVQIKAKKKKLPQIATTSIFLWVLPLIKCIPLSYPNIWIFGKGCLGLAIQAILAGQIAYIESDRGQRPQGRVRNAFFIVIYSINKSWAIEQCFCLNLLVHGSMSQRIFEQRNESTQRCTP